MNLFNFVLLMVFVSLSSRMSLAQDVATNNIRYMLDCVKNSQSIADVQNEQSPGAAHVLFRKVDNGVQIGYYYFTYENNANIVCHVLNIPPEFSSYPSTLISGTQKPICAKGSVIDVSRKTVSEQIEIAKTPFVLNYSSDYNNSRLARRMVPINFQFGSTADFPYYVQIIAGGVVQKGVEFPVTPIIQSAWTWDGITGASDRTPYFKTVDITVAVSEKVSFVMNGEPYTYYYPITSQLKTLSLYNPAAWGLGGWTVDAHHYFDRNSKTVFWGSGTSTEIKAFKTRTLAPYGLVDLVVSSDGSEVYVFDRLGKHLETKTTLLGVRKYLFIYGANDRLEAIQDLDGKLTFFNRDSSGALTSIRAPFGQITTVGIDGAGKLISVTGPDGAAHSMSYDSKGFLSTIKKPSGLQTQFLYDGEGNFSKEEKDDGFFQSLTDLSFFGSRKMSHIASSSVQKKYEVAHYPDHETAIAKDGQDRVIETREDYTNKVSIKTVAEDTTMWLKNDPVWGEAIKSPDSVVTKIFDSETVLSQNTFFANSVQLADDADPFSVLSFSKSVQVGSHVLSTTFDAAAKTLTQTDGTGVTQTSYFDGKERLIRQTDSSGFNDIRIEYNSDGLVSKYSNKKEITQYAYDSSGELVSITRLDSAAPVPIQFIRDAGGRVTQKILRNGDVIKYDYNPSGSLKKITTPSGAEHVFNQTLGDMLSEALAPALSFFAGTTSTKYEYDLGHRLQKITKPSGRTINFAYQDGTDFLETLTTQSGAYSFANIDELGRFKSAISPDQIRTEYKKIGPLLKEEKWFDTDGSVIGTLSYEYEDQSMLVRRILLNGQEVTAQAYDNANRLTRTSLGNYSYSYNDSNGVKTVTEENSNQTVSATYKYTSQASSEFSIQVLAPNLDQLKISYIKNRGGDYSQTSGASRLSYKLVNGVPQELESSDNDSYSYDVNERLISATKEANGQTNSLSYLFPSGSNGNVASYTGGGATNKNRTLASYDAQDRLIKLSGSINRDYTYTKDGDLQSMTNCYGTTDYEYDEFSNLKKVTQPGGKMIEYKVDAFNRRVKKLINGQAVEYYLWYDQTRLAAILNQQKVARIVYLYGPISHAPTQMIKDGVYYRIIVDPDLGSVRYVVDTSNARIYQEISYDAYGNMMKNTDPKFQPLAFVGGLYDEDTKFLRFGARDYDPTIGRWTTKDPIGFAGGDTNLYAYVGGNPMSHIDPSGLFGMFAGYNVQVSTFGGTANTGGMVYLGDDKKGTGIGWAASAAAAYVSVGASIGKGWQGGFYANTVESLLGANSLDLNTPIGGFSIFFGNNGSFEGISFGGPSLGLSLGFTPADNSYSINKGLSFIPKTGGPACAK